MAPTSKDPGQFDAVAQPIHPTNQKSNVHKRNYVNQNALNSASNTSSKAAIEFYKPTPPQANNTHT